MISRSTEMDVKNCQQMFLEKKKTSWKHFSMVYSLIRPKNNVKMFKSSK